MTFETTLGELDDLLTKYAFLMNHTAELVVSRDEENVLTVKNYSVTIPALNLVMREGIMWAKDESRYEDDEDDNEDEEADEEYEDEDEDYDETADWEVSYEVTVIYDMNDTRIENKLTWCTADIIGTILNNSYPQFKNSSDLEAVPCIVTVPEFEGCEEILEQCEEGVDGAGFPLDDDEE